MGSLKLLLPTVPILAIMAVLLVSGCVAPSDVTGVTVGAPCSSDSNCSDGETCIDGTCQAAPTGPVCGDGACEIFEDATCPEDCIGPLTLETHPNYTVIGKGHGAMSADRLVLAAGKKVMIIDKGVKTPTTWDLEWRAEQVAVDPEGNIHVLSKDLDEVAVFELGNLTDITTETIQIGNETITTEMVVPRPMALDPKGNAYGLKKTKPKPTLIHKGKPIIPPGRFKK